MKPFSITLEEMRDKVSDLLDRMGAHTRAAKIRGFSIRGLFGDDDDEDDNDEDDKTRGPPYPDDSNWWAKVRQVWSGLGPGMRDMGEDGEDRESGIDDEEARRLASGALSQEELAKITEDYRLAEEERKKALKEAEAEKVKIAKKGAKLRFNVESELATSQIGIFRKVGKAKAAIDKLAAIKELTMALAKDPAAAFSKTYAQWGYPLGAVFGVIAQVATYASLFAGLASIRNMAEGGRVTGGIPGQDSVATNLAPGEVVGPADSFDEIVDSVAASRAEDLAGGGDNQDIVVELDGEVLARTVVELSRRNRAI